MEIRYYNGKLIPADDVKISPDDRGFLLADGIYEVIRWYGNFFYDLTGHVQRLKRSLGELKITWTDSNDFSSIAADLIKINHLENRNAMVYLQATRGASRRTHYFPVPAVAPTIYAYAWEFTPEEELKRSGISVMVKEDIRWSRCDIKSVALLANTMSFNEAYVKGLKECIFIRNGLFTEGSHSNIFFVMDDILYTHPESNYILSGITRRNVIRIANEAGIKVIEEPVHQDSLHNIKEAFITNTSSEITPVTDLGGYQPGGGVPGPLTRRLQEKFDAEIKALRGL